MPTEILTTLAAVATLTFGVLTATIVFYVYHMIGVATESEVENSQDMTTEGTQPMSEVVEQRRLDAYSEIMASIVSLNREAVHLEVNDEFVLQAEELVMENESALEKPYENVVETYQRNYHLIEPGVESAVSDYVDYLSTYHPGPEGASVGQLLQLSKAVVSAIRNSIGLTPLYSEQADPTAVSDGGSVEIEGG